MKYIILLIVILGLTATAYGQAAYVSSASYVFHSVDSITFSMTVPSGLDRVLICSAAGIDTSGMDVGTLSSITFNTSEMTMAIGNISSNVADMKMYLRKLVAPTETTANVVVQWGATADAVAGGCLAFTGIDQTTVNRTIATNHDDATPDLSVTSAAGDLVVDAISAWCNEVTASGGQTVRTRSDDGSCGTGGVYGISMGTKSATGSTTTTTYDVIAGNAAIYAGVSLISLAPAGYPLKDIFTPFVVQ